MKCIVCGKNDAQIGALCTDCFIDSLKIDTKDSISLTQCPKCGAIKIGNRWLYSDFKHYLVRVLKDTVKSDQSGVEFSIPVNDIKLDFENQTISFRLVVKKGESAIQNKMLSVKIKSVKESCPRCNKLTGSYYEAIIQVRSYTTRKAEQLEQAVNLIKEYTKRGTSKGTFAITKTVDLPEGYDIYLMSKSDGNNASQLIHDNFFSYVLATKKLAGREGGSDLYRYTYLVRILDLLPGEIISNSEGKFIVVSTTPSKLTIVSLEHSTRKSLSTRDFFSSNYIFQGETAVLRKFVILSTSDKESEVMDTTDFKMFTVKERLSHDFDGYIFEEKIFPVPTAN